MKRFLVISFVLLCISVAQAQSTAMKAAPPSAASIRGAAQAVNDAFKDDLAGAGTSQLQLQVAKKMLQAGIETQDPASRYAIFERAQSVAMQAGDFATVFKVVDEIDKSYQIDALKTKGEAVAAAAKGAKTLEVLVGAFDACNTLIDLAVADDRYDLAKQFGDQSLGIARRMNDPASVMIATKRINTASTCALAFIGIKASLKVLSQTPSDPVANLAVAKYRCFLKGEWESGLPMLALGSDAALKQLANAELAGAGEPDAQVQLADNWWNVSEKEKSVYQHQIQKHAGDWYAKATPSLTGLPKVRVDSRLKALAGSEPDLAWKMHLVGWWKGDGDAKDSAGGNHGVIHGNVGFAEGRFGKAFDLKGGYVEVPNSPGVNFATDSPTTMSVWAFRTSPGVPFHIFGKRLENKMNYQLGIDHSAGPTPMNEWVFWTIVNDGKRCSWYVNGEFLRDYDPFGQPNAAPLRIGRSGDCGGFEGLIEDFRIYNRAMTGKEIKAMYRYFNAADRQAAARP